MALATSIQVPGVYLDIYAGLANTAGQTQNTLIIGETGAGTATVNIPVFVGSGAQAAALFGPTSQLTAMFNKYVSIDNTGSVWCLPVPVTVPPAEPTSLGIAFSNLKDLAIDFLITPYSDAVVVAQYATFLSQTGGRWDPSVGLYGVFFTARNDTSANLVTYASTIDNQFVSVLGVYGTPDNIGVVAAAYGAACAVSLKANPAVGVQGINLSITAPPLQDSFSFSEKQALLSVGVSPAGLIQGSVVLVRSCTTYTINATGIADNSWHDIETPFCLQASAQGFKTALSPYLGRPLVDDGTSISGNSLAVNPTMVRNTCIAEYTRQNSIGLVQDVATFIKNLTVTNAGNGRLNIPLPIDISNQVRVIYAVLNFLKT